MNDKFADDGDEENEDDSFPDEDKELNDEAVMEDLQDNEEKGLLQLPYHEIYLIQVYPLVL